VSVGLEYVTDPGCSWSWASEPTLRRLLVEFDAQVRITYVMGGLARDYGDPGRDGPWRALFDHWLDVADQTGAPIDPRLWTENPIRSTYPAAMAAKAAAELSTDGGARYLRALREGLMCRRRKLDTVDALTEEAARAGIDAGAFRSALGSSAIVEAFGKDVERARALVAEVPTGERDGAVVDAGGGRERVTFPTALFEGAGERRIVAGHRPYEEYHAAALVCGATEADAGRAPTVAEALRRFGRMTTGEVAAVCDLPGPRAPAELWRMAAEWRVRPERVLTGWLWEAA